MAEENKVGAIRRRTLGFVDLWINVNSSIKEDLDGRIYLKMVSSIPSLLLSKRALNHALKETMSSGGLS
jgi:hypothetical protein